MRTKCVALRFVKLKNRRIKLFRYASGKWQIKTRNLLYTPEGKVAISDRSMILSDEAMQSIVDAFQHILENPDMVSASTKSLVPACVRKSCKGCKMLFSKNKIRFCKGGRGKLNPKTGKMTPGSTCKEETK